MNNHNKSSSVSISKPPLKSSSHKKNELNSSNLQSISQIPQSIQFKQVKFEKSNLKKSTIIINSHQSTNFSIGQLGELPEDINEEDNFHENLKSDILNKNFFNKSIMEFNNKKNNEDDKNNFYSLPDIDSAKINNNQLNEIKTNGIFEDNKSENLPNKKRTLLFKLDFEDQLAPRNELIGLSSRFFGTQEEEIGIIAKQHLKGKTDDMNNLKLSFEKNIELFKKEEEEFKKKIKNFNFLDDESSNEKEKNKEKTVREKEIEKSLNMIVLVDMGRPLVVEKFNSKIFDSKISIDCKIQENNTFISNINFHKNSSKSIKSIHMKENMQFEKLMNAILKSDFTEIYYILENISKEELNKVDSNGHSPLFLAIKLAHKNEEYNNVIKGILLSGGNPKVKDSKGWTALDEAISQANVKITLYLFDFLCERKRLILEQEKNRLIKVLEELPDFYLEMKWEFESSVIPLINHIAPSDTFKIWKYGNSLRLDYSLVGIKNLKAKKRNMTLLFNPKNKIEEREDVKIFNPDGFNSFLWLLNSTNNIFTNPLQSIDLHEKKMILYDLLTSQPVEGQMKIVECSCTQSKNWLGHQIINKINVWKAIKYDLLIGYEYNINKKKHEKIDNSEDYKNLLKEEKKDPENPSLNEINTKKSNGNNDEMKFIEKLEKMQFNINTIKQKKIKKANLNMWISNEFPMKFGSFLPVINLLSKGNDVLNRLNVVLNNNEVKTILTSDGFPVKIQIPFSYSISACIFFESFKFLEKNDKKYDNFFKISENLKYTDRKIAQKIVTRPKKRLLLANLLI